MSTRDFDFVVGPETSTLPTASTPTNAADTLNKGWLEGSGFNVDTIHAPVATLAALKAIPAAVRKNGQLCLLINVAIYEFDSSDSQAGDDDLVVVPDVSTGRWLKLTAGAEGGGGSTFKFLAGEPIDGSVTSKTVALVKESLWVLTQASNWIDLNEGGGEISVQISVNQYYRISDLGIFATVPGEGDFDLMKQIADDLTADGSTTLTYGASYSKTTRLPTVSASGSFTLLLKTGAHGLDNTNTGLLAQIGWDDSSDTGSATSHAADDPSEDAIAFTPKLLGFKTDADLRNKSANYWGAFSSTTTKLAQTIGKINTTVAGFSAFTEATEQFTESAAIIITTGVNDALDWKEGAGAEINSTISAGTYPKGPDTNPEKYTELRAELKLQHDTDTGVADTFTVTYDNNTGKFKTVSDGTNSFTYLFATGTNTATGIHTSIAYTVADTSSGPTQESDSSIDLAGNTGEGGTTRITSESVYTGFIEEDGDQYVSRETDLSPNSYLGIVPISKAWIPDPSSLEKDFAEEVVFHGHCFNSSGEGIRLVSTTATNGNFKIQYKNNGTGWIDAATTIPVQSAGSGFAFPENYAGAYENRSLCGVDENGNGVLALNRYNATNAEWEVWEAHSQDRNTWTIGASALETDAGLDYYVGGLDILEDKAVILINRIDNGVSGIHVSDNSGSGYAVWGARVNLTNDYVGSDAAGVLMQFFPAETGINKHRIVTFGQKTGTDIYYSAMKGDGTSETSGTITGLVFAGNIYAFARDQGGTIQNRIIVWARQSANENIKYSFTNEDYAAGVLTWTAGSGNINTAVDNVDRFNGYTSGTVNHLQWNKENRAILVGDFAYLIAGLDSRAGSATAATLIYTKGLVGGTWESPTDIGNGGSVHDQEPCITYDSASNSGVIGYKEVADRANNLTTGKVFSVSFNIAADGTANLGDIEQIDGGEALADFQGFVSLKSTGSKVEASWEHYNGTTRDTLWNNIRS